MLTLSRPTVFILVRSSDQEWTGGGMRWSGASSTRICTSLSLRVALFASIA